MWGFEPRKRGAPVVNPVRDPCAARRHSSGCRNSDSWWCGSAGGGSQLDVEKSLRNLRLLTFQATNHFRCCRSKCCLEFSSWRPDVRDGRMFSPDVNGSQSKPVRAIRIRNIWMNVSPHHFHPRVLVKYGLISWCLAETIFMIYIWNLWSHKTWVVMTETCILFITWTITIDRSQCHWFHLQGRRAQSVCVFLLPVLLLASKAYWTLHPIEAIHAFPQWSDHQALARCECPQHRRETKSLNGATASDVFGSVEI